MSKPPWQSNLIMLNVYSCVRLRYANRTYGAYFFTVNLLERRGNDLLTRHINTLRDAVQSVRLRHSFFIHGWVVLPEHLHCVIELPENDKDFATRWRLIKSTR